MVVLGVLVMNTGTPDEPTPEAIRPYLKQFLSDRNLIDMPPALWQPILNMCILPNRPKRTAPHYQAIWTPEGSPFLLESRALGHALENQLERLLGASDAGSASQEAAANGCVKVALGMRYGNPSVESAMHELRNAGATTIVALPLYPQMTRSCAGTCFQEFDRAFKMVYGVEPDGYGATERGEYAVLGVSTDCKPAHGHNGGMEVGGLERDESRRAPIGEFGSAPRVVRIGHYWDAPGYLSALARSIREAWDYVPGSKLVVSFHSIPMSHAQSGDPYPEQTLATARALAEELGIPRGDVRLTYQSRFDGRKWIGPMLEPMLSRLAKEQVKNVAVVCPGFSVDCLETLHEVGDLAARHFAEECGRFGNAGARFSYIPALGASPALVEALAHLVAARVQ